MQSDSEAALSWTCVAVSLLESECADAEWLEAEWLEA